jgi:hypothetical protein
MREVTFFVTEQHAQTSYPLTRAGLTDRLSLSGMLGSHVLEQWKASSGRFIARRLSLLTCAFGHHRGISGTQPSLRFKGDLWIELVLVDCGIWLSARPRGPYHKEGLRYSLLPGSNPLITRIITLQTRVCDTSRFSRLPPAHHRHITASLRRPHTGYGRTDTTIPSGTPPVLYRRSGWSSFYKYSNIPPFEVRRAGPRPDLGLPSFWSSRPPTR